FVLTDVIGGIDPGFTKLAVARVAHFAHLGGLTIGVLTAWLVTSWRRLPAPYIYEGELNDMRRLAALRDRYPECLRVADTVVHYNPDNVYAMEIGCVSFLNALRAGRLSGQIALIERGRAFVEAHLKTI